jgi:hypothetical protein
MGSPAERKGPTYFTQFENVKRNFTQRDMPAGCAGIAKNICRVHKTVT